MIQFEDAKLWGIENLKQKYSEGYNIELKQLYGEYFGEIRPKLNYLLSSENNIDRNFDIFLGRMILCLGKEEVQKIFEMPEISQEDKEKIRELEKRLNGRIIEEGINKTKGKLEEEIGRQIVREQVKPIVIMVKEEIERQFKEDGKVDVEKIKRYLRERLMR